MICTFPEDYNLPQLSPFAANPQKSVKALHCTLNLKIFTSFNTYPVDIELRYPGQT
jgi:hypothetical protein